MSAVSASLGLIAVYSAAIVPSQYFYVWLTWWLGDLSGILLIAPLVLLWIGFTKDSVFLVKGRWKKKIEVALLLIVVVILSGVIFDDWILQSIIFRWAYWVIPVLVYCAIRFTQRETITAITLCSVIAVWGTLNRHGPFARASLNDSLIIVDGFISIIVVTKMALNASVTERKQTEEKLETRVKERTAALLDATEKLKEKNIELQKKNEELTAFTYIASHDLQEPLRKIQLFSKMIDQKESDRLSQNGKDIFGRIQNAAARMQGLILDLLAYSRVSTSEQTFKKTDLNNLLSHVQEELKEKIEETKTTIKISRLPVINAVPFQFEQLFINLISNAIKFARPGIPPYISVTSGVVNRPDIKQEGITPDTFYKISVTDNGIGFSPEHNEQIFTLFQRLHSASEFPGSGIGLSICKKIVENHQGVIYANGNPDVGTTIDIYLPAV